MADMQRVERLLTRRYERSMTGWLDRLGESLADRRTSSVHTPVLVRLQCYGTLLTEVSAAESDVETSLEIRIMRYLGEGEFVVEVLDFDREAALAINGALTVEGGGLVLTAL